MLQIPVRSMSMSISKPDGGVNKLSQASWMITKEGGDGSSKHAKAIVNGGVAPRDAAGGLGLGLTAGQFTLVVIPPRIAPSAQPPLPDSNRYLICISLSSIPTRGEWGISLPKS